MLKLVKRLWKEEEGQGLAEYALILALVAILCITALKYLSGKIETELKDVGDAIENN